MIKNIDINVDLGEGKEFDRTLMPLISSCNIACGGHYGDSQSMKETMELAKKHNVKIGAHPSYPDLDNFGRKVLQMPQDTLKQAIVNQLTTFFEIAKKLLVKVHHVKLHGALYNEAAVDATIARTVVSAFDELQLNCVLYVPYRSQLHKAAQGSYNLCFEAFIDRRYHSDLTLVSRTQHRALIVDTKDAWKQFEQMVLFGNVTTIDNTIVPITAQTFCIHGDTDGAVEILRYIRQNMKNSGICL